MANTKITNPELFNLGDSTSATQLPVMTTTQRIAMNAVPTLVVDYLVVAGGGGGGMGYYGGGGGAGGLLTNVGGTSLVLATGGSGYTVTVGDGGSGAASKTVNGTNGSNSRFNAIEAYGGGGAASRDTTGGSSGGSGGGASNPGNAGGSATVGQGNDGGTLTGQRYGSGGGGANQAGQIPPQTYSQTPQNYSIGAPGGNGLEVNITGVDTFYAGGGGAGARATYSPNGINGGLGGGGAGGAVLPGSNGIDELGGGGGGGGFDNDSGGSGGSGIVILRYPTADIASYTATGLTPTETTDDTDTVLSFTTVGTGTITFTSPTPTGTISTGEMIFNSDTDKVEYWDGTKWYGITYQIQLPTPLMYLDASNATSWPGGTGTTWFDLSGNNNNGLLGGNANGSSTAAAKPVYNSTGGYFEFNGSTSISNASRVTVPDIVNSRSTTIAGWIRSSTNSAAPWFMPQEVIYAFLKLTPTNTFYWNGSPSTRFDVAGLEDGDWHFMVCCVTSARTVSYYVDGQLVSAKTSTSDFPNNYNFSANYIGISYHPSTPIGFNGDVSSVRIYDTGLSAEQVLFLYNEGR